MSKLDYFSFDSSSLNDNVICLNLNETYEKIKHLGNGSFSTVSLYRKKCSTNESDCRMVALKMLNTKSLDQIQIDLAINEVKILSILKHENIINYYGSFLCDCRFYIEMEYADAGTLAEFLASLLNPLEEIEILALFAQIVSAVVYLHQQNVIHRDIKTTNIFLNRQGFIKIGDFGISKILDSKLDEARSFVGTPFYISPEICEGKNYNQPCDIWALGCVLYEMASLHKTFEANNLPTLMNKIIKGVYVPLDNRYSKRFIKLVNSLLQKNPMKRPSASQLFDKIILMLNKMSNKESAITNGSTLKELYDNESLREYIKEKSNANLIRCSYLYGFDIYSKSLDLDQVKFPHRIQVKQFSKGSAHFLILSMNNQIYSWGYGPNGELGQGCQVHQLESPTPIKTLSKYSIIKLSSGNGFSIFLTKNGLLLTCGSWHSCCLGNKESKDCFEPKLVNLLLKINVVDVSCGKDHVGVISSEGLAYTWGVNVYGKLGINDNSTYKIEPTPICAPVNVKFKRIFCGPDATALIDYGDNLWVCGNNAFNKLALNTIGIFNSNNVSFTTKPQKAKLLNKCKVSHISLGIKHTIIMTQNYKIISTGCNYDAQLGLEHVRKLDKPSLTTTFKQLKIKKIETGSTFTLALCKNSIYFCGARKCDKADNKDSKNRLKDENFEFIIGNCNESLMDIVKAYGPDYPIIKTIQPKIVPNNLVTDLKIQTNSVIMTAQSILNIYSPKTLQTGELFISDIYCFEDNSIYVLIDAIVEDYSNHLDIITTNKDKFSFQIKSEATTKHSYAWINNER